MKAWTNGCFNYIDEEICIGDYIISGGEFASLVIIEGVVRLLPEVLGNEESAVHESFEKWILDFPQYTKPREYIAAGARRTYFRQSRTDKKIQKAAGAVKDQNRPELLEKIQLSDEDRKFLKGKGVRKMATKLRKLLKNNIRRKVLILADIRGERGKGQYKD